MLTCVNRRDAEMLVAILSKDDDTIEDGPFQITRTYEVGAVIYTPRNKVTLTLDDVHMIAEEYLYSPALRAAE